MAGGNAEGDYDYDYDYEGQEEDARFLDQKLLFLF